MPPDPVPVDHILKGCAVVLAPHIDDEVLACGGLIAQAPASARVEVIFATDGTRSHQTVAPRGMRVLDELVGIRQEEARCALGTLGVPADRLHYLNLPDGELTRRRSQLTEALRAHLRDIRPDVLLLPFRYDRHPDHIAVHQAGIAAAHGLGATVYEYFVYHHWRELPGGDVRAFLRPDHLLTVDIRAVAEQKRRALNCYASQFTNFYPWQRRPAVDPILIDQVVAGPEVFLAYDPSPKGMAIFARGQALAQGVIWFHRITPALKRLKYAFVR